MYVVLAATAGCSDPPLPSQTAIEPPTASAPVSESPSTSDAIRRADALLEDFRRREAAQARFDRENPPPKFVPIPRTLVAAAQSAAASNTSDTAPPASTAPAATTAATPARDQAWWQREMQSLQTTLDEAMARLAEAEKLNFKYGYNDAQAEYKKRAAAVAGARQAIERLRDDARRAGVPPGWLRP